MSRLSRNKGKTGERELARELSRLLGCKARRGVQYCGGTDSPDVIVDIPDLHIECKRTEKFRLYDALSQATEDAGTTSVPVVCHRSNKNPWVAVVRLDDLPKLAQILNTHLKEINEKCQSSLTPTESEPISELRTV
ncbi:MAG: putative PDDEXK endonuclease [Thermoguttaceae bacterium]